MSMQPLRGLVPTSAGTQVPTLPEAAQVRQAPAQAVLQQTPSTQMPEPHFAASVQGCPSAIPGASPWGESVPPPSWVMTGPSVFVPASGFLVWAPPPHPPAKPNMAMATRTTHGSWNIEGERRTLGWGKPMLIAGLSGEEARIFFSRWREYGDFRQPITR
jgi:hypothetical protein